MTRLGRYRDGANALRSDIYLFVPYFLIMCVHYCSACATLRESNVSEVQQPVNNAIVILVRVKEIMVMSIRQLFSYTSLGIMKERSIIGRWSSWHLIFSDYVSHGKLGFSVHCISYLAIDIETASVGDGSGLNFIREYG
jgi:hypothetical protein